VQALCFTPDGKILISRSTDGLLGLWRVPEGSLVEMIDLEDRDEVHGLCFVPTRKMIACGGYFGAIVLVRFPDEMYARMLEGHPSSEEYPYYVKVIEGHMNAAQPHIPQAVPAICVTPDDTLLASAGYDATVRLWRLPEGEHIKTLKGHTDRVQAVCSSPNGKLLASASSFTGGTIRLWKLPDGQPLRTIESGSVFALCFTPDGSVLASRAENGEVVLWNVSNGEQIRTIPGYADSSGALCVAPDGKTLIGEGTYSGTVQLWSLPDGKEITTLGKRGSEDAWEGTIRSLCLSPYGKMLAGGSQGGSIFLWRLA